MKAQIINKMGHAWDFESLKEAQKHIKKVHHLDYELKVIDDKKVAVYDCRNLGGY
jgi:hypothetical protein